jgi:hypothetical protein
VLQTASLHSYKTAKGTRWCIRWRENGKQRHETVPGYGRQAKEIARERASEIELGRHYEAPPQTLGAFLADWRKQRENRVKPSTLKREWEALWASRDAG